MSQSVTDERFEVWDKLSEFFLDTNLDRGDYERIATVLARSNYSIDELRDILDFEVEPACKWNMLSMAGEWAGFSPEWIIEHIAPRKNKRPRFSFGLLYRSLVRSSHWKKVEKIIIKMREHTHD